MGNGMMGGQMYQQNQFMTNQALVNPAAAGMLMPVIIP